MFPSCVYRLRLGEWGKSHKYPDLFTIYSEVPTAETNVRKRPFLFPSKFVLLYSFLISIAIYPSFTCLPR